MCCFSSEVESVSDTHIFARAGERGRQYLVYEMKLKSQEDLAMILPLPTPPGSAENAVNFINLKDYAGFFKDMAKGFEPPPSRTLGPPPPAAAADPKPKLAVVPVGNFEASFVPSVADFERLDERFRLPKETWSQLPLYAKYGFAVFKLKKGEQEVHPMAFSFPRLDATRLFFPTVHIHDGKVHDMAEFDHALYCQSDPAPRGWTESKQPASFFLDRRKSGRLISPNDHAYQKIMKGKLKNLDVFV